VKIKIGKYKVKTKIIDKTLNPVWNEKLKIKVDYPYLDNKLSISLYDHDYLTKNDFLGYNSYDIENLLDGQEHKETLDVLYQFEKHGTLEITFKITNTFKTTLKEHYEKNQEYYSEEKKSRLECLKNKNLLNFLIVGSTGVGKSTVKYIFFNTKSFLNKQD
jgi:Ca2+-dependent lipid-binding protein